MARDIYDAECMESVRRETAALRQDTAALDEATAVAVIAGARHRYAQAALVGAMIAPAAAWDLRDIALGIVILPNVLALVVLSGQTRALMDSYFERKRWL